jgi:hypothetical protein
MDEIDHVSERLRTAVARFRRRKLVTMAIRWTLTAAFVIWVFPRYPWLYWTLLFVIPLEIGTLWLILSWTAKLEAKFNHLADRMREIQV